MSEPRRQPTDPVLIALAAAIREVSARRAEVQRQRDRLTLVEGGKRAA